jgi:hypothetical protein
MDPVLAAQTALDQGGANKWRIFMNYAIGLA